MRFRFGCGVFILFLLEVSHEALLKKFLVTFLDPVLYNWSDLVTLYCERQLVKKKSKGRGLPVRSVSAL